MHVFYLCLFCIFFVVVLLRLCFLLYALNYSHNIYHSCIFFSSRCCLSFLCIFQYSLFEYLASFRFFKVMLSCGIVIFHSSPTNKTSAKTALIIFNIFTFFLLELLSVLVWAFFNKKHFTVFNTELIKRFHRVRMVFWGIYVAYIDKIYNMFYVLPFFDLAFQLLNLYTYILNHLFVV